MLETVTCCSGCSHDTSFVVRRASGNALVCGFGNGLGFGRVFGLSGKHFEYRNARDFWNYAAGGESGEKSGRAVKLA